MQVSEYMSPAPVTIDRGTDYKNAFKIMQEKNLHHLPVLDEADGVIGLVARRDLELAAQHFHEAPVEVGDVMHTQVTTIDATASLKSAVERMTNEHIGCLPVVDGGGKKLVGIITHFDMMRLLHGMLAEPT